MDGVDPVLEPPELASRELVEVGSLRIPPPDEAVAILDGAFLVGGVGARVVCLGPEGPVEPLLAEEFAAVVRRHAPDRRQCPAGLHAPDRHDDLVLVDVVEVLDDVAPRAAVQHDQQPASGPALRDDGVHLVVPELLRLVRGLRPVPELPPAGDRPCLVCRHPRPSSPAGMVWGLPMEHAHVARLDVVVERLEARHVPARERFYDHHPRVVRRAPELQHGVPEEDGHAYRELHLRAHVAPALADRRACLVYVVLRVCPAVAAPEDRGDSAAPELPLPGGEGDVVDPREVPQRDPGAAVDVPVPGRRQDFSLPVRQV